MSEAEWRDWKWQFRNRFTTAEALRGVIRVTEAEEDTQSQQRNCALFSADSANSA